MAITISKVAQTIASPFGGSEDVWEVTAAIDGDTVPRQKWTFEQTETDAAMLVQVTADLQRLGLVP